MANMNDHWKLRLICETRAATTQMGALCLAILNHTPNRRPYFKGLGTVDKDGVLWVMLCPRSSLVRRLVPVGHIRDVLDEMRRLADRCQMNDREVKEFFEEIKKWVERDARAKSTFN